MRLDAALRVRVHQNHGEPRPSYKLRISNFDFLTSVRDKKKAEFSAQQGLKPMHLPRQEEKEGDNAENLKELFIQPPFL